MPRIGEDVDNLILLSNLFSNGSMWNIAVFLSHQTQVFVLHLLPPPNQKPAYAPGDTRYKQLWQNVVRVSRAERQFLPTVTQLLRSVLAFCARKNSGPLKLFFITIRVASPFVVGWSITRRLRRSSSVWRLCKLNSPDAEWRCFRR